MMYNPMELMICCAARLLENGRTVAVDPVALPKSRSVEKASPPVGKSTRFNNGIARISQACNESSNPPSKNAVFLHGRPVPAAKFVSRGGWCDNA